MATNTDFSRVRPWQVLSSETTYQDKWLKIRRDHCLTADGLHIDPYHVIEYPDWVNVVALTRDGLRLILVREYRHGLAEIVTGLVSGAVEPSDGTGARDPAEATARRELQEETGYRNGTFIRILDSYPNPANQDNSVTSFLALDVEPSGELSFDKTEAVETSLHDLPAVLTQIRSGELRLQAMHIAALWSAAAHLLAGGEALAAAAPLRAKVLAAITMR